MKKNVGSADKILRIIVGIGIIGAGVYYQSWWGACLLYTSDAADDN